MASVGRGRSSGLIGWALVLRFTNISAMFNRYPRGGCFVRGLSFSSSSSLRRGACPLARPQCARTPPNTAIQLPFTKEPFSAAVFSGVTVKHWNQVTGTKKARVIETRAPNRFRFLPGRRQLDVFLSQLAAKRCAFGKATLDAHLDAFLAAIFAARDLTTFATEVLTS